GNHLLIRLDPDTLGTADLSVNLRVLSFTLGVSIISAILFGMVPALQVLHVDLIPALRDESRRFSGGRRGNRSRNALVVAQVALSMILLIGSGLLLRSFIEIRNQSQGFDPTH